MSRPHLPPYLADRFTHAFVVALAVALHRSESHDPPARTAPPANDWPEWSWAEKGGKH